MVQGFGVKGGHLLAEALPVARYRGTLLPHMVEQFETGIVYPVGIIEVYDIDCRDSGHLSFPVTGFDIGAVFDADDDNASA